MKTGIHTLEGVRAGVRELKSNGLLLVDWLGYQLSLNLSIEILIKGQML